MNFVTGALFSDKCQTPEKDIDPTAYRVVSVRLRHAEFESLSSQVEKVGLTNNMALRIAARRIAGFLELDAPTRIALQSISQHIGEISTGIREISLNSRAQGRADVERLARYRAEFGDEFVQLDRLLRILLNVSRRRTDGCSLISAQI